MAAVLAAAVAASLAQAQGPARLRWQAGQVLVYKVEETIQATEVVADNKAETRTQLNLTKRWQVLAVSPEGVATLQLSLAALKFESLPPGGDPLRFDSAEPARSTPDLRDQLGKLVGVPLATLRVDGLGRVVEVKESRFGPAARFEKEPPFVAVLPAEGPKVGQNWERNYQITLEPPAGTGEKIAAVQRYACKAVAGGLATVSMTTELKLPPAAGAEQLPHLELQPEGEIVFDCNAGRMQSARLKVDKEAKGVQGEGSSYRFQRAYTEQYVGEK
jgi:hypothetical protein